MEALSGEVTFWGDKPVGSFCEFIAFLYGEPLGELAGIFKGEPSKGLRATGVVSLVYYYCYFS